MDVKFNKLPTPTIEVAECFQKWESDPALIHLIRPNKDKDALEAKEVVRTKALEGRLEPHHSYLIYLEDQLV